MLCLWAAAAGPAELDASFNRVTWRMHARKAITRWYISQTTMKRQKGINEWRMWTFEVWMKGWSSACSVVAASQTPEPCIACVLCRCILYTDMQLLPYTLYMYSAPLAPDPPPQSPRVAKPRLKGQLQLPARTCNCRCIQTPGYFYETCSVCAIYNELNRNQGSTLCQRTHPSPQRPPAAFLARSDLWLDQTHRYFWQNSPQIHLKYTSNQQHFSIFQTNSSGQRRMASFQESPVAALQQSPTKSSSIIQFLETRRKNFSNKAILGN